MKVIGEPGNVKIGDKVELIQASMGLTKGDVGTVVKIHSDTVNITLDFSDDIFHEEFVVRRNAVAKLG